MRTLKKAWARTIALVAETFGSLQVDHLAIVHVGDEMGAIEFCKQLLEEIPYSDEALYTQLTPGISVPTGAGRVGVCLAISG